VPVPVTAAAAWDAEQAEAAPYWERLPAVEASFEEQQGHSGDRVQLHSYMALPAWETPVPYQAAFAVAAGPYLPGVFAFYPYPQASFYPFYQLWLPVLPFSFWVRITGI
jgi:hypothetical protein